MALSYVESKYSFSGDFDVQVDYSGVSFDTDMQSCGILLLEAGPEGEDDFGIARLYFVNGDPDQYEYFDPDGQNAVVTSDTSGKLRAVRIGSAIECFYWTTEWVSLGSKSDFVTTPLVLRLYLESIGVNTTVYFDNYLVNSGDIVSVHTTADLEVNVPVVTTVFAGNSTSVAELEAVFLPVEISFIGKLTGATLDIETPGVIADFGAGIGFEVETGSIASSFTGLVDLYAELDVNVPNTTSSFSASTPISASLSTDIPSINAAFTGITGLVGSIEAEVPGITTSFTALGTTFADLDIYVPSVVGSFSAISGTMDSMEAQVPIVTAEFSASTPSSISLDANIPVIEASFTANPGLIGSMNAHTPAVTCDFSEAGESEDVEMEINIPAILASFSVDNPVTHSVLRHIRGEIR